MKHTIRAFLVVLLLLALSTGAWAYTDTQALTETELAAVEALSDMGIVGGYTDGSFRPDADITRAEFAKMLCLFAAQEELAEPEQAFSDVPPAVWYYGWVSRATRQGWMTGYPGAEFKPQNSITQQEVAAVLLRLSGVDTTDFNWPDDYIAAAEQAGLTAEISFNGPAASSRLLVCRMLYQLLPQQDEEQPAGQDEEQAAEQVADGFYLGVVESVSTDRSAGADLKLFEREQVLPLSVRRAPAVGSFIYYTVKDGKIDSLSVLLSVATGDIAPTTALTRVVVADGPYAWASRQTGEAVDTPPELSSVKPTVQYVSYRNLNVGPNSLDNRNYWLSDDTLIYEVSEGEVKPGSRDSVQLKQEVVLLADKNDVVIYLFCFMK